MFSKVNLSVWPEKADNLFVKTAALCALGLCLTVWCLMQRPAGVDDFRAFYRGAQLVGTAGGVYSHPALDPETGKSANYLPYIRIPVYALLLKPLTALTYATARKVWIALMAVALAALVPLYLGPRDKLAIALCFSLPVVYAVMLGQDIALVLLIVLAAARLAASDREFAAGFVVSLLAIKPTYLVPAGLVFVARSRRGAYGLALGGAIQLALCFAAGGLRWPFEYLALLRNPLLDLEPRRMLNLRAITSSLSFSMSLPPELFVLGSIALLAWLWAIARRRSVADALILALPIGMLASPHSYIYDAVVAIPLLVMYAGDLPVLLALTPLPYLALMSERAPVVLAGSLAVVAAVIFALVRSVRGTVARVPRIPMASPGEIESPAS